MDAEERDLRIRDGRRQLVATIIAILSFVASAVAVVTSFNSSQHSFKQSTQQFTLSSRNTVYNDIITGLSSASVAVQDNSLWRLEEFVEQASNYPSEDAQVQGVRDAIQTLDAFIEDNSTVKGFTGLTDYESPQPIILSRAVLRLREVDSEPELGSHDVDVSRGNFHGVSLSNFAPNGDFSAVNTDFRRANVSGFDVHGVTAVMSGAFFTCANLSGARFGSAQLDGVDFTGADLSGARLNHVKKLKSAQFRHVTVDKHTRLPPGVVVDRGQAWPTTSAHCVRLVDSMTGMHGGQGYTSTHPCPATLAEAREQTLSGDPPFDGKPSDLFVACRMRNS